MTWTVESPNGLVEIEVALTDGSATYEVRRGGVVVVDRSRLGLVTDDHDFSTDLVGTGASESRIVDDEFTLPHGKQRTSRAQASERTVDFAAGEASMSVIIRAYDDGAAFRYGLTLPADSRITGEVTQFAIAGEGRAFMQPHQAASEHAPAYERPYSEVAVGHGAPVAGWVFPSLFEAGGYWTLLTEADLDETYHASHLEPVPDGTTYTVQAPSFLEGLGLGSVDPDISTSWTGPWRALVIGPDPASIFESNLVRHLSRPAEGDYSWVRPGRGTRARDR